MDAHDYGFEWPLKYEVEFITSNFKEYFIIIDDFKVPHCTLFGYDSYNEQECSYDFIKDSIKEQSYRLIYPGYTDKTSKHHPLRGWGLIVPNSISIDFPKAIKNNIIIVEVN